MTSRASPLALLVPALNLACVTSSSSSAGLASVPAEAAVSRLAFDADEGHGASQPLRVLVTGFNDWKDLGEPPNLWRCRDNPSCRLLLGAETLRRPTTHAGPLVARLRAVGASDEARPIEWSFATMPVTWGIAETLPEYESYDVVVHLGLGVYDNFDTFKLEDGAFNARRGEDAAGSPSDEEIAPTHAERVLDADARTGIARRVRALDGAVYGAYTVDVVRARPENAYLCNETHFWAIARVNDSVERGERLRQAYFVHIPYAKDGDYGTLADGVAGLIATLLEPLE